MKHFLCTLIIPLSGIGGDKGIVGHYIRINPCGSHPLKNGLSLLRHATCSIGADEATVGGGIGGNIPLSHHPPHQKLGLFAITIGSTGRDKGIVDREVRLKGVVPLEAGDDFISTVFKGQGRRRY